MSHIAPFTGDAITPTPAAGPRETGYAHDLDRIVAAFRKRWRLFLAIAGGFAALVAFATIVTPKSYTTTVRLLAGRPGTDVAPTGPDTALPVLNALVLQSGVQSAETLAVLAQQHDLAASVISKLNLQTTPEALLGRISVKPVVNTTLLSLSVKWKTPDGSAQIANAFAGSFVEQERDFVRSEAVSAIGFLSKELPNAQAQMRKTGSRLAQFQSAHGYMDATAHQQDVVSRVASVDQRIDQLSVDASEANALLNSVNSQMSSMSATVDSAKEVAQNPVSADLRAKLADVETQLSAAQQKYTPAHPAVIALRQQRAALTAQLAAEPSAIVSQTTVAPNPVYQTLAQQAATYRARIEGDQGQLHALRDERLRYRPSVKSMPEQAMQFAAVAEEAKRAANVYNALQQKYSDALVAQSTAISDIIVVSPATADAAVKSPSLRTNLSIALAVGILLGLAVVYVLELFDRRTNQRDYAALLGLPVIARIPAFTTTNPAMLPWLQSMTLEAFLHLCVTLKLRNARSIRTLAVLSARRAEGKSTVAYHLAKSLATLQPGVLLIDADLRQPTLHEKANCPNAAGLEEVLGGSLPLHEAVQNLSPGFDILTSSGNVANPVALLQSTFETVLEKARQTYGMVIVDSPAFTAVSDALLIAAKVDASLFVVTADRAEEQNAQKAVAEMVGSGIDNIVGIVVNKDVPVANDYDDYFARMNRALTTGAA